MGDEAMWGDVRGMLDRPPSALLWRELWAHLEACGAASDPEQRLITYLQGALSRWPDHLRIVPTHWHDRMVQGSPLLALCRALHLGADDPESGWSLYSASEALDAPVAGHLTTLSLARFDLASDQSLSDVLIQALARLPELRELVLEHVGLTDAHVVALCEAAQWRELQVLACIGDPFGEAGCRALARCEALRSLHALTIVGRPPAGNQSTRGIGVEGVQALTASALLRPAVVTLRHAGPSSQRARDWSLDMSAPFWRKVHTLDVGDNPRLVSLTLEPNSPLRWLIAPRTGLSEGVLRGLLAQGALADLEVLDLSDRERVLGGAAGPGVPQRVITSASARLDTSSSWDHGKRPLHELGPGWWDWEAATNPNEVTLPLGTEWAEPGVLRTRPGESFTGLATRIDFEDDEYTEALATDHRLSTLDVVFVEQAEYGGEERPLEPFLERWQAPLAGVKAMVWNAQPREWSVMITDLFACDPGALLDAFPALEWLGMVYNPSSETCGPLRHERLKTLIIPSACMPALLAERLAEAHLPALEGLEVWGGDPYYWQDCANTDAFASLLTGRRFPHLKHLGLRNHRHADALAHLLLGAPLWEGLESMDWSMGLLTNAGLRALMREPHVWRLKRLNVSQTYVTDEAALSALAASGVEVIARHLKYTKPGEELYVEVVE